MKNIFKPQSKLEKVSSTIENKLHIKHQPTFTEKVIIGVQRFGLYFALFLAGYVVAKLQTLLSL